MLNKKDFTPIEADEINDNDIQFNTALAILEQGYDQSKPIIVSEEGEVLDGRHRYIIFEEENRLDEVSYIVVDKQKWFDLIDEEYENGTDTKFFTGKEYFWNKIKETFPKAMENIKK